MGAPSGRGDFLARVLALELVSEVGSRSARARRFAAPDLELWGV